MVRPRIALLAFVLLSLPHLASAQVMTLDIDLDQSRIEFGFGATLHNVVGAMRMTGGQIQVDAQTGAASGTVEADATSAQTGVARRDRKMHEKILESAHFPKIAYTVERIDGTLNRSGRSEIQLHGTLEMHGTRKPAAIPAVVRVEGDKLTATGLLTVPYMDWGLRDPSVLLLRVEKEVRVTLKIVGRLHDGAASAARSPAGH